MKDTTINMTNVYDVVDAECNDRRYEFWFTARANGLVTVTLRGNDKYEQHTEEKALSEVDAFIAENNMVFVRNFRTIFAKI
jgi:hypothetical protein